MELSEQEKNERERIRQWVLRARTLAEVRQARQLLCDWLKRHPDDFALLGEGESLVMLESALLMRPSSEGEEHS